MCVLIIFSHTYTDYWICPGQDFYIKCNNFPFAVGRGDSFYIQISHLAQGPFCNKLCQVEECDNALRSKLNLKFYCSYSFAIFLPFYILSLSLLRYLFHSLCLMILSLFESIYFASISLFVSIPL